MDIYNQNTDQEDVIDLLELANVLLSKLHWIVITTLLTGIIALVYTTRFVTPMYQASIKMIVNSKRDAYTNLTATDVINAESMVKTYATVIKSNRVMDQVIESLHLDVKDWTVLNSIVSVNPVDETPVMNVVVTHPDPVMARKIVTAISEISPELIVDAVEAGSCKVISDAYCSGVPVSPNVKKNTVIGMAAGFVASCGIIVLLHLLNDSILSEEQMAELTKVPVLSTIPMTEMDNNDSRRSKKKGRRHR